MKTSKEIIVPADKSHNWYKIPIDYYNKMITNTVTKDYKHAYEIEVINVNKESLYLLIANEPGLEKRVEILSRGVAFITVKDHKSNFPSRVDVRLLNPSKSQIGKISKIKLQEINSNIRSITKLNQLQSSQDAISWFKSLKYKKQRYFLMFDIKSYYPSIKRDLLKKTFNWARTIMKISKADENLVFMARRSFLFMNDQPWVEKKSPHLTSLWVPLMAPKWRNL